MAATKQYEKSLFISNNLGIPAYDYIDIAYNGDNTIATVSYYRGGKQDSGKKVGELEMTYDGSGNLISVERKV